MPILDFDPAGKQINVTRLLTTIQSRYASCVGVGLAPDGHLKLNFTASAPAGWQAALANVLTNHDGTPDADPDDVLLDVLRSASTLPDVKAALIAWFKATRGKQ